MITEKSYFPDLRGKQITYFQRRYIEYNKQNKIIRNIRSILTEYKLPAPTIDLYISYLNGVTIEHRNPQTFAFALLLYEDILKNVGQSTEVTPEIFNASYQRIKNNFSLVGKQSQSIVFNDEYKIVLYNYVYMIAAKNQL